MTYFKSRLVADVRCKLLGTLSYWDDIKSLLLTYIDESAMVYKRGLECVDKILIKTGRDLKRHKDTLSEIERITYLDFLLFTNIEVCQHPVSYMYLKMTTNDFDLFKHLTTLTIEMSGLNVGYDVIRSRPLTLLVSTFFKSELRQRRGHLVCYRHKVDKFNLIPISNLEDSNFIFDKMHRFFEIDVTTGKYVGPTRNDWLLFLQEVVPTFTIRRIDLISLADDVLIHSHAISNAEDVIMHIWYGLPLIKNVNLKTLVIHPQQITVKGIYNAKNKSGNNSVDSITQLIYMSGRYLIGVHSVEEVSMANVPSFRQLRGMDFIVAATEFCDELTKALSRIPGPIINQLKFKVFTNYKCVTYLIRIFPNVTEVYYIASLDDEDENFSSLDRLFSSLSQLSKITIFTALQSVVERLSEYYRDSDIIIDLRLV